MLRGAIFIQKPMAKNRRERGAGMQRGEERYETTDTSAVCGFFVEAFFEVEAFVDTSFFEAFLLKHFC